MQYRMFTEISRELSKEELAAQPPPEPTPDNPYALHLVERGKTIFRVEVMTDQLEDLNDMAKAIEKVTKAWV